MFKKVVRDARKVPIFTNVIAHDDIVALFQLGHDAIGFIPATWLSVDAKKSANVRDSELPVLGSAEEIHHQKPGVRGQVQIVNQRILDYGITAGAISLSHPADTFILLSHARPRTSEHAPA